MYLCMVFYIIILSIKYRHSNTCIYIYIYIYIWLIPNTYGVEIHTYVQTIIYMIVNICQDLTICFGINSYIIQTLHLKIISKMPKKLSVGWRNCVCWLTHVITYIHFDLLFFTESQDSTKPGEWVVVSHFRGKDAANEETWIPQREKARSKSEAKKQNAFQKISTLSPVTVVIPTRIIIIYSFRVFHISVSWWFFPGVRVTASLLKSPGLVSGFWPFSAMLSFG